MRVLARRRRRLWVHATLRRRFELYSGAALRTRVRPRERDAGGSGSRGQTQLCIYSAEIRVWPCTHPPLPPTPTPLAGTSRTVSGQISPTVGSAGLCGGLFILERGLPSGSLHLSKHPPAAALCSRALYRAPTASSSLLRLLLLLRPHRLLLSSLLSLLPLISPSRLFPFPHFCFLFAAFIPTQFRFIVDMLAILNCAIRLICGMEVCFMRHLWNANECLQWETKLFRQLFHAGQSDLLPPFLLANPEVTGCYR